jgi:hypothetical protein
VGDNDAPAFTEIVLVMIAPLEDFNVMTYFVTWLAGFVAVGTFRATITFVLFTPIATAVAMTPEGIRAMETGVPVALTIGVGVGVGGVVVVGVGVGGVVVVGGGVVVVGVGVGGVVVVGVSGTGEIVNECTTSVAAA